MSYTDVNNFSKELLSTYLTIIDIVRFGGDNGIVNKKRQQAYKKAISDVETTEKCSDINLYVKELSKILTDKPRKVMQDLFNTGHVELEKKSPYNGAYIVGGKIKNDEISNDKSLNSFQNLNKLVGIGIGIGDSCVMELVDMGYSNIDQLKIIYERDKFKHFRKGLQGPLCKYFEGTVRIEKMSRSEATKWKETIDYLINKTIENAIEYSSVEYKIAGSYARQKQEIGDIDYVIVTKDNEILYRFMNDILDKLSKIDKIGNDSSLNVTLDSVVETPSKAQEGKRYTTGIKMWFKMFNGLKTKIEVYGYTDCEFCFPYYARSCEVELQKKIKILASKKGYKLSPWGLFDKDTDEKINLEIKTIRQLYNFLEYKSLNKNDY